MKSIFRAIRIFLSAANPVDAMRYRDIGYFAGIVVGQLLTIFAYLVGRLIGGLL